MAIFLKLVGVSGENDTELHLSPTSVQVNGVDGEPTRDFATALVCLKWFCYFWPLKCIREA